MAFIKYDLQLLVCDTRSSLWQIKMWALLAQADYDDALDNFGKNRIQDWTPEEKRKDREALSQIQLHLHNDILQDVLSEKTAAALWLKLEEICMTKDLTSKMHLKQKLFLHKLSEGGNVLSHISEFKEIITDLAAMEVKYEEEDMGLMLLCSLPSFYTNFRDTILYSRDTLTLNEVYEALHSKEKMKLMVSGDGSSSSQAEGLSVRGRTNEKGSSNGNRGKSKNGYRGRSQSRGKKKYCRYCKKEGHDISECFKLQNKEKRNATYKPKGNKGENSANVAHDESSDDALDVIAGCAETNDKWVLDTACSFHMCPYRDWFNTLDSTTAAGSVLGFDNSQCKIEGIGSIRIKMSDGTIRTLTDVRYIPKMKRNLISLSALDAKGYKYSGGDNVLKVTKGSLIVMKGDLSLTNGLYYLRGSTVSGNATPVVSNNSDCDAANLWTYE
jgi:hypothetical protein